MKPISQPSFTKRPIHQSLLNFCGKKERKNQPRNKSFWGGEKKESVIVRIKNVNLFYVEEILGVKGDGCGWDRNIFIQCATVADIGPHGERHGFGLWDGSAARSHSMLAQFFHRWWRLPGGTAGLPWLSPAEWWPAAPAPVDSVPVLGSGWGSGSGPGPAPPAPPPGRHLSLMVC